VEAGAQDLGDADVVDVEGHGLALQDGGASVGDLGNKIEWKLTCGYVSHFSTSNSKTRASYFKSLLWTHSTVGSWYYAKQTFSACVSQKNLARSTL
jgi:hypothetical protein